MHQIEGICKTPQVGHLSCNLYCDHGAKCIAQEDRGASDLLAQLLAAQANGQSYRRRFDL